MGWRVSIGWRWNFCRGHDHVDYISQLSEGTIFPEFNYMS